MPYKITIPYPIKKGPYTIEETKKLLIKKRDWYELPPEEWFIYLLGMTQAPQGYSWYRQAAKELIEENYRMQPANNEDSPYYPMWIGESYWKKYEGGWLTSIAHNIIRRKKDV